MINKCNIAPFTIHPPSHNTQSIMTSETPIEPKTAVAQGQYHEPLSSELLPTTDATLTIRIIKSFEFRTQKSMVIKGVNLEVETVGGLMQRVKDGECFVNEDGVGGMPRD